MYSSDNDDFGKFIKKPKAGQKVKVYPNVHGESSGYGIVIEVKTKPSGREIVLLDESFIDFSLDECHYCLEKRKVEFKKPKLNERKN